MAVWAFLHPSQSELVDEQEKSGMIRNYSARGINYKTHERERERGGETTINKDHLGQC